MEEPKLQQFITFIQSKSVSYWVLRGVLFFGGLYILSLFISYTIVDVKVVLHDNISESTHLQASSPNHDNENIFAIGNIAVVRRDSFSLKAIAGSYQTDKSLETLPLIGIASVTVNVYKDHDVKKYSGDSLGCLAYDQPNDTVLSYSCGTPEYLVRYDRPTNDTTPWGNTVVAQMTDGFPPIYSIKPFQHGVLGLQQPPQSDKEVRNLLFYIDSTGKKQLFDIPPELNINDVSSLSLVTDAASAESNHFLLVSTKGTLYLGEISNESVSYKTADVSDKYDSGFDALLCNLVGTTVYCYFGKGTSAADSSLETSHNKNSDKGAVETINFSNDNPKSTLYTFSSELNVGKIFVSRSKKVYVVSRDQATQKNNIYRIFLADNKASPQPILSNITTSTSGDGLYFVKNNALYRVDDKNNESYLVFSSAHVKISNVVVIADEVFINGFITDLPDQKLHTYRLLDSAGSAVNGKRTVDILPIYMDGSMLDIDYADNIVRVRVFATATPDKVRDKLTYDEAEYVYNRSIIENQLNSLGITPDKYQIIYSK